MCPAEPSAHIRDKLAGQSMQSLQLVSHSVLNVLGRCENTSLVESSFD